MPVTNAGAAPFEWCNAGSQSDRAGSRTGGQHRAPRSNDGRPHKVRAQAQFGSSLPTRRGLSIGLSLTFARADAPVLDVGGDGAECHGLVVSALPGHRRVDETPHRTPDQDAALQDAAARARRPLRRCGPCGRSARAPCVPAQGPAA